jgi:mono/diheme cytochrome c family protein
MKIAPILSALVMIPGLSVFASVPDRASAANASVRSAAELYGKYCVSCHGRDGQGKTPKGRLSHARNLADATWQDEVSDERIFNSIMNGRNVRGNMPAFNKKISDQEADSLLTFVRSLKK